MSETEQETPEQDAEPTEPDTEEAEAEEAGEAENTDAEQDAEAEPDEGAAEAEAEAERARELAAERQAEAQSLDAQKAEQDRQRKQLDKLAEHVAKRYQAILGEDLGGFIGCELCADYWPGVRLPIMPQPHTVAAVKTAIGEDPDPPLNPDGYSRRCDGCDGWGVTASGSRVASHKRLTCYKCAGKGWLAVGSERENGQTPAPSLPSVEGEPVTLEGEPARTAEEETLRRAGAIVVWPPKPPPVATYEGV